MKRIKAAFIIWFILAAAAYVLTGSKGAAAMCIVAAIYCALALVMVFVSGKDLKCHITGVRSVDKNAADEITVTLENESKLPVPAAGFTVHSENVLTKEQGSIPLMYSFLPKGKGTETFTVSSPYCGRENISVGEVSISDPAGLFHKVRKLDAESAVYVMPEIKEIEIPADYLDSYDMESYKYSQHKKGSDAGEVFGIREYADGDSPKQIHWKLSAKMDDMMVKIPSFPIENKLIVLLDNSLSEKSELNAEQRNDLMETFFSLSYSLLKKNIPHSLGWCDHETGAFIVRQVSGEGEMWAAVPEALSAGIEQSRLSTAYRFLAASGEEHFTNHFIVTAGEAAEIERLAEYGQVKVFRSRGGVKTQRSAKIQGGTTTQSGVKHEA